VAEDKGRVGRLPQALIKRPKAFPVQPFLRFSGKLAVTNDVDHALDIFIVHSMCRLCRLPFDRVLSKQYRASQADTSRAAFGTVYFSVWH